MRVLRSPSRRRTGRTAPGARRARDVGWALLVWPLLLPLVPGAGGTVTLQVHGGTSTTAAPSIGPITATSTVSGVGVCASTETASVPFALANARGSSLVVEPRTCASNHRLVFLPALRFTDALLVAAGHILTVRLTAVLLNGTTSMLRNVQLYVQQIGAGNPIVTGTHVTILRGAVFVASSSTATLAAGSTYGIGLRMQLTHFALSSTAHVAVLVHLTDADGGRTNAVVEEWAAFTFTY